MKYTIYAGKYFSFTGTDGQAVTGYKYFAFSEKGKRVVFTSSIRHDGNWEETEKGQEQFFNPEIEKFNPADCQELEIVESFDYFRGVKKSKEVAAE